MSFERLDSLVRERIPAAFRHHPFGTGLMVLWGALGCSMLANDGKPWPDLLWPGLEASYDNPAGYAALYIEAGIISLSSVLWLSSHPLAGRYKWAAFTRWLATWFALTASASLALGSLAQPFVDGPQTSPWWPASFLLWVVMTSLFALGLRVCWLLRTGLNMFT